jgi:hypothetical protein
VAWFGVCVGSLRAVRCLVALLAVLAALVVPNSSAGAEDLPAYDDNVLAALTLLDASPATNQLRGVLESNRVSIQFMPLPPGVYARYSVGHHAIEIDRQWQDVDVVTLAAVIAHEATHAQDAVSGYLSSGGASACVDSEIRAFRTSALFWLDVFGPHGNPAATDDLDRQLNAIADRQLHDPQGLEALVRQTYAQQCAH